jgi:exonuclease III
MVSIIEHENSILQYINEFETNLFPIGKIKSLIYVNNACNIMVINICSVRKHLEELCIILDNGKVVFDVIILYETWLGNENVNTNAFRIPNFSLYFYNINKNQNDGVTIFIHKSLIITSSIEIPVQSHTALEIQLK